MGKTYRNSLQWPPWEAVTIQVRSRSRPWEVETLQRGGLGSSSWREVTVFHVLWLRFLRAFGGALPMTGARAQISVITYLCCRNPLVLMPSRQNDQRLVIRRLWVHVSGRDPDISHAGLLVFRIIGISGDFCFL